MLASEPPIGDVVNMQGNPRHAAFFTVPLRSLQDAPSPICPLGRGEVRLVGVSLASGPFNVDRLYRLAPLERLGPSHHSGLFNTLNPKRSHKQGQEPDAFRSVNTDLQLSTDFPVLGQHIKLTGSDSLVNRENANLMQSLQSVCNPLPRHDLRQCPQKRTLSCL